MVRPSSNYQFDSTGLPRGMPSHPDVSNGKGGLSEKSGRGCERNEVLKNSKYRDKKQIKVKGGKEVAGKKK